MNTKENLVDQVAVLGEMFSRNLSPAAVLSYVDGLIDLEPDRLTVAFREARRTCEFMPTVAALRALSGVDTAADQALKAWGEVEGAIFLGPYKSVDFADPSINATIRNLGGWPSFLGRFTDAEAEKWARKEFLGTYATYAKNVGYEAGRPLPGLSQVEITGGIARPVRPVRIGTGRQDVPRIESRESESGKIPRVEFKGADDDEWISPTDAKRLS